MQQSPATQAVPTPPAAQVTTPGVSVDGVALSSPQSVHQGFRAQRRELARQLETLEHQRREVSQLLSSGEGEQPVPASVAKGLELRLASIDERISALDKQIAESDAAVARSAAVPGAAIDPPSPPRQGPPEEAFVLGGMFMFIVLLPLTIAYARRIWRRSAKIVTAVPKELSDRLMRVEQTVEATALEVERIGEGQRFMTKLFTEGPNGHALRMEPTLRIPRQSSE